MKLMINDVKTKIAVGVLRAWLILKCCLNVAVAKGEKLLLLGTCTLGATDNIEIVIFNLFPSFAAVQDISKTTLCLYY